MQFWRVIIVAHRIALHTLLSQCEWPSGDAVSSAAQMHELQAKVRQQQRAADSKRAELQGYAGQHAQASWFL